MVSSYIAWYLFLAGMGGGSFLVGATVDFALRRGGGTWFERVSTVTDAGLFVGPLFVALGAIFLFLDLGRPGQAFHLFLFPSGSLISLGSWAITLFCICAIAALFTGFIERGSTWRAVELLCSIAASILAVFVVLYAGIFLSLYSTVPFLHTPFVPLLFVVSSLLTGVAALVLIGFFRSIHTDIIAQINCLAKFDIVLIFAEAVVIIAFLAYSLTDKSLAAQSVTLLFNEHNMLFWLGVVVCGLIVPLLIDFVCFKQSQPVFLAVGALCTLIGGVCLRFALLMVAQRFDLATMGLLVFWR